MTYSSGSENGLIEDIIMLNNFFIALCAQVLLQGAGLSVELERKKLKKVDRVCFCKRRVSCELSYMSFSISTHPVEYAEEFDKPTSRL